MDVHVSKPQLEQEKNDVAMFRALVDTGATITSISQKVVDTLSLIPDGWKYVTGVHGSSQNPTYTVALSVPISELVDGGDELTFSRGRNLDAALLAFQPSEFDVLLGMDLLEGFHLTIFREHFILSN